MSSRTVLLVAYHFPPSTAVGGQRTLRFARHLPDRGWRPVVLTIRERDLPGGGAAGNGNVRIPEGLPVYRSRVARPLRAAVRARDLVRGLVRGRSRDGASDVESGAAVPGEGRGVPSAASSGPGWVERWIDPWFTTPDGDVGWCPFATMRGLGVVRRERASLIYTSGPPHSSHLIGSALSRWSGRPWIADLRDPWTRRPWLTAEQRRGPRYRLLVRMEARLVRRARRVILNTEPMAEEFREFYSDEPSEKFVAITNGFDPESFEGVDVDREPPCDVFTIAHAGSLYRRRDPRPLLEAVTMLRDRGEIRPGAWRLRLIGPIEAKFGAEQLVAERGLSELVSIEPPVPHDVCLEALVASHLLLIVQPGTHLQVPGKLFEYMYLGKPVLSLTGEGATADIIRENGMGSVADPDDAEGIAAALSLHHRAFLEGRSERTPPGAAPGAYHGREVTMRLADLLDEVADER